MGHQDVPANSQANKTTLTHRERTDEKEWTIYLNFLGEICRLLTCHSALVPCNGLSNMGHPIMGKFSLLEWALRELISLLVEAFTPVLYIHCHVHWGNPCTCPAIIALVLKVRMPFWDVECKCQMENPFIIHHTGFTNECSSHNIRQRVVRKLAISSLYVLIQQSIR